MPDNELIITLKMDRTLAEKEAAAFHEAEKKRIAKLLTDSEIAEKAKTALIQRENRQRVDAASKVVKTEKELEKEIADNRKRLEKEAVETVARIRKEQAAEAKRLAKEQADEERRLIRDVERAAKDAAKSAADDARQWDKRALTEKEAAERAKTAITRQQNRERVQMLVQAQRDEQAGLGRLTAAWGEKGGAIGMSARAVGGYVAAFSAVGVGVSILNALDDKWRAIARGAMEAAKATAEVARNHLELSGFAGTPGQTAAEQQKTMELVAASGIPIAEATELRKAAGAGAYGILDREAQAAANGMPAVPAKQGLMSPEEYQKAQVYAARMGAFSGGNAADYGKAVAMVPALAGKRMNAEQVAGELVRMDKMATLGGFETPSDLIKQLENVQGYVKSGVVSPQEGAALVALAAKTTKDGAGTLVKQAINAVSAGTLMDRGVHIDEEMRDQYSTSADYFKSLGIERNMGVTESMARIADDMAKQAPGTNLDQYLLQKGLTNQESRQAFLSFHGNRQLWDEELMPMMTANIGPEAIDENWKRFIAGDVVGRENVANANKGLAENAVGQRAMSLRQMMMNQHSLMVATGQAAVGSFDEYATPMGWNPIAGLMRNVTGVKPNALLGPIAERITAEMQRLNLSTDLGSDNDGTRSSIYAELTGPGSMEYKSGILNRAQAAIQGAGGDPTGGGVAQLNELVGQNQQLITILEGIRNNTAKPATAPAGGRPAQPRNP